MKQPGGNLFWCRNSVMETQVAKPGVLPCHQALAPSQGAAPGVPRHPYHQEPPPQTSRSLLGKPHTSNTWIHTSQLRGVTTLLRCLLARRLPNLTKNVQQPVSHLNPQCLCSWHDSAQPSWIFRQELVSMCFYLYCMSMLLILTRWASTGQSGQWSV